MRIPSEEAFAALEMGVTAKERDALSGHYSETYHSEHTAFLVLTALRNNVAMEAVLEVPDYNLDTFPAVKKMVMTVSPKTSVSKLESFFWSIPLDYDDEDRIYLISAFLTHGESFSSLLVSFRNANNTNVPEFVPVTWFQKFFDGEESLRDEGIVLQAEVSMVLFGYWDIENVIDFLVRNVDLKEVTKLRAAGIEDAEEIADITELLPAEWLDEFFG
jgi:hypothetical protein